ncbi:MAG: GNAT family N-acetyltransferase [Neomegalonema sp.]|nr:GNAT family N-acetyltransferase [Neomegalonema sp.]
MADGTGQGITIRCVQAIAEIDAAQWDACADPGNQASGRQASGRQGSGGHGGRHAQNPFSTHRFLLALEQSGSATAEEGWAPQHLIAEDEAGQILGAMPLYVKTHSQGEYVFDHGWADAFMRAGGDYYPKLQAAVPFTPVTGQRVLLHPAAPDEIGPALIEAACALARSNHLSSLHITFCTQPEWERFGAAGLLQRQDQQFHFINRGYADFDAFLASLASRKRKQVRKERETAMASGVAVEILTGDDLRPEHWDAFWTFYQDTGSRKWGSPYLTRAFFDIAQATMREDIVLVMARREGRWVAGALNFLGADCLYGRYWGCVEDHPCLHFELCYYQAIDIALARGLDRVEAGAQGAHKLARGYEPVATYSLHWITHPGFRRAIEEYLTHERAAVAEEIEELAQRTPFRKGG